MRKLLVIEPKLTHWTTVEPLIICFLKKGWKVEVIIPKAFVSIFGHYSKVHNVEHLMKNLTLNQYNKKNIIGQLFKATPDVAIVANRFFLEKPQETIFLKKIADNLILIFNLVIKMILILLRLKNSYFVITTHFVDVDRVPYKSYTKNKLINYFLDYLWKQSQNKSKAINVYSSLVKENYINSNSKKIFVAPNAIYRYKNKKFNFNKKLMIAIPGRIDKRRRYYEWIDRIKPVLNKFEIKFIGKALTESDLEIVKKLDSLGASQVVKKVNQFISFEDFDKYLESADMFFVPLVELDNPKRRIDRNLGAFFDSVRYGKPLIVPNKVPICSELKKSVVTYNNDSDLLNLLIKLSTEEKTREKIKEKALQNSLEWTAERMQYVHQLENHL